MIRPIVHAFAIAVVRLLRERFERDPVAETTHFIGGHHDAGFHLPAERA
jgi:hypothetical protein